VNDIEGDVIALSLIPETLKVTTLGYKNPGDKINVEADVLAKHIERLMETR
jgi:riboflavin synthase